MPVYGKGECLYGLIEECRLGDKGIEVDPIYCLNCTLLKLGETLKEITLLPDEDSDPPESNLR